MQDDKPDEKVEATKAASANKKAAKEKPAEPSSFTIRNMTRVTPLQFPFVSLASTEGRYQPIRTASQIAEDKDKDKESSKGKSPQEQSTVGAGAGAASSGASKDRVSGNIVILRDTLAQTDNDNEKEGDEEEQGKYIELDNALWPKTYTLAETSSTTASHEQPQQLASVGAAGAGAGAAAGAMGDIREDEAEMPEAFEYPFEE